MIVFEHSIWPRLAHYARLSSGRGNVDLLQLPEELRAEALAVEVHCVACGAPIQCFRARLKSKRSRISGSLEERRLFYAATCSAEANSGCSRSKAAKDHKKMVADRVRGSTVKWKKPSPAALEVVKQIDASIQFAPEACREAMLAARALLTEAR